MDTKLKEIKKQEFEFVKSCGGYWEVTEFDTAQNDFSRAKINCFPEGSFLGNINFYDEDRKNLADHPIMREYRGQSICNFEFAFIVPKYDELLAEMIKSYNLLPFNNKRVFAFLDAIFLRIETLGGESLTWV